MRTRRNVYNLPEGDLTLYWYAVGVAAMKRRPTGDPLSWSFQGAVHGIAATVPPAQRNFWSQCQHGNSFFLPWHRMYLLRFERIVAAHIASEGGPADWALPYWDYSNPTQQLLPPAFRDSHNATGAANPLYVRQRFPAANAGSPFLSPRDVDLQTCLTAPGTTTFGGFFGERPSAHFGSLAGALELTPHNAIHRAIGRSGGWMADPDLAALDPIFWLHHSNVDRLWEVWLNRDPNHQNLSSPYWLNGVTFQFFTETGAIQSMQTLDVLDLAAPTVDYKYEDISDPLGGLPSPGAALERAPMVTNLHMELAGATMDTVELGSEVRHVELPTPVTSEAFLSATAPADTGLEARTRLQQVALVLENVTSNDISPTYDVYLNVPDSDDPNNRDDRFIGRAALFGIAQASDPKGQHGGSGQTIAFDVTGLYKELANANELDQNALKISFVPVDPENDPHVIVGRISLYFA